MSAALGGQWVTSGASLQVSRVSLVSQLSMVPRVSQVPLVSRVSRVSLGAHMQRVLLVTPSTGGQAGRGCGRCRGV